MATDLAATALADSWQLYQPRFWASSVDPNDVETLSARIATWDDWWREWCRVAEMHEKLGDEAMAEGHEVTGSEAYVRATMCYQFAQFMWHHRPEEKEEATRKLTAVYRKAAPFLFPPAEVVRIPFEGTEIPGYLRLASEEPAPCVLLLPGADSVAEQLCSFETDFHHRGISTLSINGPGQGSYRYIMPMRQDYEKAVSATVDFLAQSGKVDLARLGVCGTSYGGYLALRCAAFEPRLKTAVSIGGRYDMAGFMQRKPLAKNNLTFLFGKSNWEEAAAFAEGVTLKGLLHRVTQPVLVVHGSLDSMVPMESAARMAEECPDGTLKVYEGGNHVCNNMPYLYRPFVTDWMREKLG